MDNSASSGRSSIPIPKSQRGINGFIKEVGREMKKVNWPSVQETNRLTGVVLAVVAMLIAVLTGLSFLLQIVVDFIITGKVGQ